MVILIMIGLFLLVMNALLIRHGGRGSAIAAACVNAVPVGFVLLLVLAFDGREWYRVVSWTAAGVLLIGFISGWALRVWNGRRIVVWLACFTLAVGGIWGSSRHEQYLRDITLPEYFRYEAYTPFTEDTLAVSMDEEPVLRFTMDDPLPGMDGATALYPVYAAFAQAVYPDAMSELKPWDIRETVACSTTASAYRRIVDGGCDIIFAALPSEEQEAYAAEKGVELKYTPIGREAFVFFVHPDNPIEGLTLDRIRGIYSGEITRWDQLGVGGLGKILAYQREEGSGSQTALKRFVMRDAPLMAADKETHVDGMGGIVESVSAYKNHRNAIGFSFRFYCTALMKNFDVKLLAVNGTAPTVENIENGTYPLASDFYAVTRSDADENTLALLEWICGPQGQALVEKTGYTPYR